MTFSRGGGQNLNFAHPTSWIAALRGGKDVSALPVAPPRFSIGARPTRLDCEISTESVWGLFSGGAEVLRFRTSGGVLSALDFDGQTPLIQARGAFVAQRVRYVLDDLSKSAGYVVFGTVEPGSNQIFFVQDATGRFLVTVLTAFEFHNRLRLRVFSGACRTPPPKWEVALHCEPPSARSVSLRGRRVAPRSDGPLGKLREPDAPRPPGHRVSDIRRRSRVLLDVPTPRIGHNYLIFLH